MDAAGKIMGNKGNAPVDVRSLARTHTRAAIKTLVGIMNQPKCHPSARVHAAEALLDRGWGKATQLISDGSGSQSRLAEIKLTIVDARRDEKIIEHDDTKPEPVLIEDKRKG
jgi:hypothetical protein